MAERGEQTAWNFLKGWLKTLSMWSLLRWVISIVVGSLVATVVFDWTGLSDFRPFGNNATKCAPVYFTPSDAQEGEDRLAVPRDLRVTWEQSSTDERRLAAQLHWFNVDARTTSNLIEVSGRMGDKSTEDIPYRLDGRGFPAEGTCGHWYRNRTSSYGNADAYFDGLWEGETYCFEVNAASGDRTNGLPIPSASTPTLCETAGP